MHVSSHIVQQGSHAESGSTAELCAQFLRDGMLREDGTFAGFINHKISGDTEFS